VKAGSNGSDQGLGAAAGSESSTPSTGSERDTVLNPSLNPLHGDFSCDSVFLFEIVVWIWTLIDCLNVQISVLRDRMRVSMYVDLMKETVAMFLLKLTLNRCPL
jgi:hypothetical protein